MLAALAICLLAAPDTLLVALGDAESLEVELRAASAGRELLSSRDLLARLTGGAVPRPIDRQALARMLEDARQCEARFESAEAMALRQRISESFGQALRPDPLLRPIIAAALHDSVAALLAEGKRQQAAELAREVARRFADEPIDSARHPPPVVELVAEAQAALARAPRAQLRATPPAQALVVDGVSNAELEVRLVPGRYVVWAMGPNGPSLPHTVELPPGGLELAIDVELESCLGFEPAPALLCREQWAAHLERLAALTGARVVGVSPEAQASPGEARLDAFSPLYLVPFGAGQLSQERSLAAAGWAVLDVALLGWHVSSWLRHAEAVESQELDNEPALRRRRNLSAGLFWGALAASAAEAVLYGLLASD